MPETLRRANPVRFAMIVGGASKRPKRAQRLPKILYPSSIERRYRRIMREYVSGMQAVVDNILVPKLQSILERSAAARPTLDSVRIDEYDYAAEIRRLMDLIATEFFGSISEAELFELILGIAEAVANQNGKELGKVFTKVLGVNPFQFEPWLAVEMRAFVTDNVGLIKTIPSRYFAQIEEKVFSAARSGLSYRELMADIQKSYKTSKARAELIARDQIGKFNGQLSELRLKETGIRRYVWNTMRDERVRPEHKKRDGKVFSWDDPPAGGHPGFDYQCRCYASPFAEDLWKLPGELSGR